VFYSTLAFQGSEGDFARRDGGWVHEPTGAPLDPEQGRFVTPAATGSPVERLQGFDTYWYMWSLTNPDTDVLKPVPR
jgi:hypothetical protein